MYNAMVAEENREWVTELVFKHADEGWEAIFDRVVWLVSCPANKEVLANISTVCIYLQEEHQSDKRSCSCSSVTSLHHQQGCHRETVPSILQNI